MGKIAGKNFFIISKADVLQNRYYWTNEHISGKIKTHLSFWTHLVYTRCKRSVVPTLNIRRNLRVRIMYDIIYRSPYRRAENLVVHNIQRKYWIQNIYIYIEYGSILYFYTRACELWLCFVYWDYCIRGFIKFCNFSTPCQKQSTRECVWAEDGSLLQLRNFATELHTDTGSDTGLQVQKHNNFPFS